MKKQYIVAPSEYKYIKLLIYIINIFNYMNSTINIKTKKRKEKSNKKIHIIQNK